MMGWVRSGLVPSGHVSVPVDVLVFCFTRFSVSSPCTPRCKFASTSQGRTRQSRSHPPAKVASTSQSRIHQSGSHPPVKVSPFSQGLTPKSRSSPPIKVTPTGQGRTHQARSHPPVQVAPTSQGRVATWRALSQSTGRSACPAVPCQAMWV